MIKKESCIFDLKFNDCTDFSIRTKKTKMIPPDFMKKSRILAVGNRIWLRSSYLIHRFIYSLKWLNSRPFNIEYTHGVEL